MTEKACRNCHAITTGSICPNCKTSSLSDDFTGLVIIFNPDDSAIAKVMKINKKGQYALRVR